MYEYERRAERKRRAIERRRVFRRTRFHRLRRFVPLLVQLSFRRKGGLYDKGALYGETLRRARSSIMGCAGS